MTQEEAEAFVWGPWEFNTHASVQIATNRVSQTRAYSRVTGKNWDLLPLRRTRPGHWMSTYSQQQWQGDYEDHPVRLLITCRREGYEPWTLLQEVTTGPGPEEKKQASEIKVQSRAFDGGQAGVLPGGQSKPVHMLVVTNASARPIRNLAAEINVLGSVSPGRKPADVVGRIPARRLSVTPPYPRPSPWLLTAAARTYSTRARTRRSPGPSTSRHFRRWSSPSGSPTTRT